MIMVISEKERAVFARMSAAARRNTISVEELHAHVESGEPFGDMARYQEQVCVLLFGVRVFITMEEQKFGLARHLSVSVAQKEEGEETYPSPVLVETLMEEFGFRGGFEAMDAVYLEERFHAVNVIQRV